MVRLRKTDNIIQDFIESANKSWERVQVDIAHGVIDRYQISEAMNLLNQAHAETIRQNKRELI